MKKIALVIRLFQERDFYGGGERFWFHWVCECLRQGHQVDIYCTQSSVTSLLDKPCRIFEICKPYQIKEYDKINDFYHTVKQLLAEKSYDAIVSENITPPLGITFLHGHTTRYRQRVVRGWLGNVLSRFRPKTRRSLAYEKRWLKQGYTHIAVPSNLLKYDLMTQHQIPESRISVIYPGVTCPKTFTPKPIDAEKIVFGLSAPGFSNKGGYVLLKALAHLKRHTQAFHVNIIYAKHKQNRWLQWLLWRYGLQAFVTFLPYQDTIQTFFQQIDCLVLPSLEETFGMIVLEAMAAGKPCIVGSQCGASELITHGQDGWVLPVNKNAPQNWAKQMQVLIEDPQKMIALQQPAFQKAQSYTWERMFQTFETLLGESATK